MREPVPSGFILSESLPLANIYYHPQTTTAMVVSTVNFIPIESFKETFEKVYNTIESEQIRRVIFDKRSLTIFHQPSMEWYYTQWKVRLYKEKGVQVHGKILPKDEPFRQSVHSARTKILQNESYPELQLIRISYYEGYKDLIEENATY